MKQSSSEPPQKKLKQARLPFQILSPPVVKNCEVSPISHCKRKACETSDEDVVVSEINENKITPLEKKAKVVNKEKDDDKRQEGNEDCMEVGEVEEISKTKSSATKPSGKKSRNSSKTAGKATTNRKSYGKNSNKISENGKTEIKNSITPSEKVDIIDLCDSPAKNTEDKSTSANKPKYKGDSSVSNIEEKLSDEELVCKSLPPESGPVLENKSDRHKEMSMMPQNVQLNECKNFLSHDKIIERSNTDVEFSEKVKANMGKTSSDTKKDSVYKSKSPINKSPSMEDHLKQPSFENTVISQSPRTDFIDTVSNATEKINSDTTETNEHLTKSDSNQSLTPSRDLNLSKSSNRSNIQTPASNSLSKNDSSPSSECDTSSLSTPGTDPIKKISKTTPRRMTPKQLLRHKEKEEKKKEKERLREEKEKKKAEEKEEKLKLKKEKEEERIRLKQEKEDEKRKEKEEKERKKQAELEQKNEEKRLKEEEKKQKEEEKRAKDEDKRKKEEEERKRKEEKRLKEEQKEAEKRKSAQAFASFFVKTETKSVVVEEDKENLSMESNFRPFEVKNDMRLAPLVRTQLPEERRQSLESILERSVVAERLYLEQIRSPSYVRGLAPRTWPPPDNTDDEVIIIESEKPTDEMEVDENETEKKPEKRHSRAKLLQFHENRRPPYWGTWRKKSKFIRPRAPLSQDKTMLEYEVDSDEEWEEPEDGESLRGSDDEESQDEQYEEDNDMFVPHGYLSDGEGEDELDDQSPEAVKAKLKLLQIEFEAERSEKQEKLKPRIFGCVWVSNSESTSTIVGSKIAELFLLRRAVWEGSLPITVAPSLQSSPSSTVTSGAANTPGDEINRGTLKKVVKESLVPDIVKKVHGSRKKLSKMLVELLDEWNEDKTEALPSKKCLAQKIRELAIWERPTGAVHYCWYMKEDVRRTYGLNDVDLPLPSSPAPSTPSPASNITKFTKVLTTDERLKLLRESPVASKEGPKATPNKTVKTGVQSPAVKKRVSLITVGSRESPKQNTTTSIINFVTKSAKSEESENTQKLGKPGEKVKKRITPITLTTAVTKPTLPPPSSDDVCIILDD